MRCLNGNRSRVALLFVLTWFAVASSHADGQNADADLDRTPLSLTPCLAIIIDDMGYNLARGQRALSLPADVTYAMLPFTDFGRQLATEAHAMGREVMLHIPMASASPLMTPGELSPSSSRVMFARSLASAIADIPYIRGVNNHMGSELTQQDREMRWLMENIGSRGLFFVDSRTTELTVAATTATQEGVPNASRDVFLDHDTSEIEMSAAWQRVHQLAHQNGSAILIAHPYQETLDFLQTMLADRTDETVKIVPVSELIERRRQMQTGDQRRQRAIASARSNVPS